MLMETAIMPPRPALRMRKTALVQGMTRSLTSGCCAMISRFSRLDSRVDTSRLPALTSAATSCPVYAAICSCREGAWPTPVNGSRQTLQT